MPDDSVLSLRHTLATLAYRADRALRNSEPSFAEFQVTPEARKPVSILAHMGDLMAWAVSMARGEPRWANGTPMDWDSEVSRFFSATEELDRVLASGPARCSVERLFQGPIADALTHVGQIAILRGLSGHPIGGENYFAANIESGRAGRDQVRPVREF